MQHFVKYLQTYFWRIYSIYDELYFRIEGILVRTNEYGINTIEYMPFSEINLLTMFL